MEELEASPDVLFETYSPTRVLEKQEILGSASQLLTFIKKRHDNVCLSYTRKKSKELMTYLLWIANTNTLDVKGMSESSRRFEVATTIQEYADEFPMTLEMCKKRFFIIPVTLSKEAGVALHRNFLIFDTHNATYELYDPQGQKRFAFYKHSKLEKELDSLFPNFKRVEIDELCPIESFQSAQVRQKRLHEKCSIQEKLSLLKAQIQQNRSLLKESNVGFCQAWSIFYLDLRLSYPDMKQKRLQEKALENLEEGDMTRFISGYMEYATKK